MTKLVYMKQTQFNDIKTFLKVLILISFIFAPIAMCFNYWAVSFFFSVTLTIAFFTYIIFVNTWT